MKAWTEIATPSLEVLGNRETQMHNQAAHACSVIAALLMFVSLN